MLYNININIFTELRSSHKKFIISFVQLRNKYNAFAQWRIRSMKLNSSCFVFQAREQRQNKKKKKETRTLIGERSHRQSTVYRRFPRGLRETQRYGNAWIAKISFRGAPCPPLAAWATYTYFQLRSKPELADFNNTFCPSARKKTVCER